MFEVLVELKEVGLQAPAVQSKPLMPTNSYAPGNKLTLMRLSLRILLTIVLLPDSA